MRPADEPTVPRSWTPAIFGGARRGGGRHRRGRHGTERAGRPDAEPPVSRQSELLERVALLATHREGAHLDLIAEAVGLSLGARRCRLESWAGNARSAHDWPDADPQPLRRGAVRVPIRYGGGQVGLLGVELGAGGPFAGRRRALRRDLGRLLGPVLHATAVRARIAAEVRAAECAAAELGEIRSRSVAEQEDDRRALERDLHDGAQHHLVTLRLTVSLLDHDLGTGDVRAARDRLRQLDDLLDITANGLTATAAGVLPRRLLAAGLIEAFQAELGTEPEIDIDADPAVRDRRYPVQVEVAVFYACLEAVNNAHKHAPGAAVRLRLRHTYRGVGFAVDDDGQGFDPAALTPTSGLMRLADRLAAAGGELQIRSAPGSGTTVEGFIPV